MTKRKCTYCLKNSLIVRQIHHPIDDPNEPLILFECETCRRRMFAFSYLEEKSHPSEA
ncbi:hypothetical protein PAXY110619_17070 [Paenibacillus xylanexedens]|uniref:DUF2197 domain-containing protein n=1 Tax=Paenibacillus xylanexedens TaxID=528191 RepID=A0ABS4S2F4_PAEXY|nr:hypothetical protein [Paenibacillus xylanexedens]